MPIELIDETVEAWREDAACGDPASHADFFPEPDDVGAVSRAKSLCASCPVSDDCLSFAIETRQDLGIWGGTTPPERKRIRRLWIQEMREAS
jgi:WhiB family transcriptional regulator, redox-sensing transcriptional regulator